MVLDLAKQTLSFVNSKIGNAIKMGMSIILSASITKVNISHINRKFEYG